MKEPAVGKTAGPGQFDQGEADHTRNADLPQVSPVRFTRSYDPQALECPRCRGDWFYLHHHRVEVFERREDYDYVNKTSVEGKITAVDFVPNDGSGNPSSRRNGIRIHFWCECCGDGLILNIAQHKGGTFFEWTINPPRGPDDGRP